jgi:sugar phosphate permease
VRKWKHCKEGFLCVKDNIIPPELLFMNKRRIAVLSACFVTVLITYSVRYSYGVLLPEMLPSLAISKAEAGVIYSSFFIAYTVFSPLIGLMSDRYDARKLLTIFITILGSGTLLMSFASSLLQACFFYVLVGIGSAAGWAPVMALAQRWTPDKDRGKTLAFVDIGSALGIIFASAVLPLIVTASDWTRGWLTLGILGIVTAALNFILIKSRPPELSGISHPVVVQQHVRSAGSTYLLLLRDSRFWFIGLAYLLTGFAIIIPITFLTTYANQELEFTYENAARLLMVIGISAVVGKIVLGTLSDRIRRVFIMMICALLIAGGALGMVYARGVSLTIVTIVFGIGYGAVWAMYAASASDHFPREHVGSIVGLWTVFLGIGSAIAPAVAGWLADTTGTLSWSFALASAGALVSFLLLLPLTRAHRTPPTPVATVTA